MKHAVYITYFKFLLFRKLEEEYVTYAADVERRATEVGAATPEIKKEAPLCPICLKVSIPYLRCN